MTTEVGGYAKLKIPMPNHIFNDMCEWVENGELKVIHKEFTYSYYWSVAFLWRLGAYHKSVITQKEIKQQLGYNPNEKRINYIIKKKGLLDFKEYTEASKNYPLEWRFDDKGYLEVTMLDDFEDWQRESLGIVDAPNYFVKIPLLHMGEEWDGLYWHSADTHMVSSEVFFKCMGEEKELGCAGFFLYGLLKMTSDKLTYDKESKWFECDNAYLCEKTGWDIKKVMKYSNALRKYGLIGKWQPRREKGSVNTYKILVD